MVVVKQDIAHQRADHLSRLSNGKKMTRVDDDLPDAYLFNIEMVPQWSKNLVSFLTLGRLKFSESLEGNLSHIKQIRDLIMLAGRLYKRGTYGVLRMCIESTDVERYLQLAHVTMGNIHCAPDQTVRRIEQMGIY